MKSGAALLAPLVVLLTLGACGQTSAHHAAPIPALGHINDLSVYVPTDDNLCLLHANDGKQRACYSVQESVGIEVLGDVVYGANLHAAYALRASDGKMLWQYTLSEKASKGRVTGLALAGGTLYTATQDSGKGAPLSGTLYALQASDGTLRWRDPLDVGDSAVTIGDTLYAVEMVSTDGINIAYSLIALRTNDGGLIWRYPLGTNCCRLYAVGEGVLYITGEGGLVTALREGDRVALWHSLAPGARTLQAIGNVVYVNGTDNQGQGDILYALRASDGTILWQLAATGPVASLTVAQGIVYTAPGGPSTSPPYDNSVYAVRASDGRMLWRAPITGSAEPLVVVDDRVFVGTVTIPKTFHQRTTKVYALDAQNGHLLWDSPITPGYETYLVGPIWVG